MKTYMMKKQGVTSRGMINHRGQLAFTADLSEGGGGIFLGGGGSALSQVVRFGPVAPGTGGGVFAEAECGNKLTINP